MDTSNKERIKYLMITKYSKGLVMMLIFSACPMCQEGNVRQDKEFQFNVSCTDVSSKDRDLALSEWYVSQYGAIEELSEISGVSIEYGSKIKNTPQSLLDKQKEVIQSVQIRDFDRELAPWVRSQKEILEKLASTLKCKIDMGKVESLPLDRKCMIYLEYQEIIISKINDSE
ncbi:hypothetical protein JIN85_20325 [Luteolibacter pohnpeiensis]|uniref:Uncharacterized protein n=1 Tax=Luteolibacter pohnpeiensis TaxID=454153 RepID=A0A934S7Z7_9BACT|nr:hypothetical protein [Luteolibacter pohnpeiensis]MBK1884770.1 hypothetical protein [Luteolibacter pohnpeiensis]